MCSVQEHHSQEYFVAAGAPEAARSSEVPIAANGSGKATSGSEAKLAPSTPEATPQGGRCRKRCSAIGGGMLNARQCARFGMPDQIVAMFDRGVKGAACSYAVVKPAVAAKPANPPPAPKPDFDLNTEYYPADLEAGGPHAFRRLVHKCRTHCGEQQRGATPTTAPSGCKLCDGWCICHAVQELAKDRTFKVTLKPLSPHARPLQMFIGASWDPLQLHAPQAARFTRTQSGLLSCIVAEWQGQT